MKRVELTREQYDTLDRLLRNKAKELWAWRESLKSSVRDAEYNRIMDVMQALLKAQEVE